MTAKSRKPLLVNLAWTTGLLAIAVPVLYVVSFGPACWLTSQVIVGGEVRAHPAMVVYWPLGKLAADSEWLRWWMTLGLQDGHSAIVPMSADRQMLMEVR